MPHFRFGIYYRISYAQHATLFTLWIFSWLLGLAKLSFAIFYWLTLFSWLILNTHIFRLLCTLSKVIWIRVFAWPCYFIAHSLPLFNWRQFNSIWILWISVFDFRNIADIDDDMKLMIFSCCRSRDFDDLSCYRLSFSTGKNTVRMYLTEHRWHVIRIIVYAEFIRRC